MSHTVESVGKRSRNWQKNSQTGLKKNTSNNRFCFEVSWFGRLMKFNFHINGSLHSWISTTDLSHLWKDLKSGKCPTNWSRRSLNNIEASLSMARFLSIAQTVIHGTGSHLYKSAIDQPKNLTRKTYGICTLPATPVKSQKWHPKLAAVRRSQPWLLPPAFRFQKTIWIHWIHGIQGSLSYVFDVCYSKKSNISIYMVWFVQRHKSKASSKTHGKKHTKGQKHLESQWNVQMSHRPPCSPSHLLDVQFQWWATSKSSNSLLGHGGNRMTALTRSLTNSFLS